MGSCHLIQLITDSDGLWETRLVRGFAAAQLTHTGSVGGGVGEGGGGYLANNLQHAGMQAKPGFWGKPKRLGSEYGHLFVQLVFNETRLLPLWSPRHISPHICHRLSNVHSLCHALQLVRSSFFVRNDICIHPLTRGVWGGQPSPLVAGEWGGDVGGEVRSRATYHGMIHVHVKLSIFEMDFRL